MSDNELLMMAAKAAGYDVDIEYYGPGRPGKKSGEVGVPPVLWNPLTDNGDALRLAVELKMNLRHNEGAVFCTRSGRPLSLEKHEPDILTATRRAIVRAAAKIGEPA